MYRPKNKFLNYLLLFLLIYSPAMAYDKLYDTQLAPNVGTIKANEPGEQVIKTDREKGYYIDNTGQIEEFHRIPPPNPEQIPAQGNPVRTVLPFDKYYDVNVMGIRKASDRVPVIPNYNTYYSERRAYPYTKDQFMNVWCTGLKYINGVDCQTEQYAITFIRARDWAWGVIKAQIKAKKAGKKAALFVMVDDLGLDAKNMHDTKNFAELFNMKVFFGTIDSEIPLDWIVDSNTFPLMSV